MPKKSVSIQSRKSTKDSDEKAFYKILVAFFAAAVAEILLIVAYRRFYAGKIDATGRNVFAIVALVMAVLVIVSVLLAVLFRKKREIAAHLVGVAVIFLLAFVSLGLMARHGFAAAKLLCAVCPALLLLYIVAIIYQREFFVSALTVAVVLLELWAEKRFYVQRPSYALFAFTVSAVLCAASVFCALLARKNAGVLNVGKYKLKVYELPYGCAAQCVTGVMALAASVLGYLFPGLSGVVSLASAAYLFVLAVYYTVRLM